jgi:hypothetical protein
MRRPWTFGEVFVLRHPGFPFDWIEGLGIADEAQSEIAALLEAERTLQAAADAVSHTAGLATGSALDSGHAARLPPDATPAWVAYHSAWLVQRERAEAAFHSERRRLQHRLHELASEEKVQEAVFLSSPDAFENVWSRYVDAPSGQECSASRRTERLVYSYLQRFCAKNETTSFFGPMGYGDIAGDDDTIEILPAPQKRKTFIAYWAVEALAAAAATEKEFWSALPIRRSPLFVIDEKSREARCDALDRVESLSSDQLRVLDGVSRCSDAVGVAACLGENVAWVESVAMSLFVTGILVRRIWFRSDQADSLANLCRAIESLPSGTARERWLANLGRLETLRAAFEVAPLTERRVCLRAMESLFVELTQRSPRRAGGRLYTDRLIVNEEASSPFRVRIGRAAGARLASMVSPMLDICAAYGEEVQREFSRRVVDAIGEGAPPMTFHRYASRLLNLSFPLPSTRCIGVADERAFDPRQDLPESSDKGPRFALPDLCLARGPDGTIHPILSSVHHLLLTSGWLFAFHPEPSRVDRVAAEWVGAQTTWPLVELATGRHNKGYYSFPGRRAAHVPAELIRGSADQPVFPASELTVTVEKGRPTLRGPGGHPILLYLPLSDLTLHAPFTALSSPPVVFVRLGRTTDSHGPRLDMGGATYQRARWDAPVANWKRLSGFALFVAMQRTRVRLGLPRFVFARVPGERKPFLVDTHCPFAVELCKHLVRDAKTVSLEEMLPSPEQLWLRDGRGRYTFELRIQAQRGAVRDAVEGARD